MARGKKPRQVLSYARSASADAAAVAAQHERNADLARADGFSSIEEITDNGYSGATLIRPGLASIFTRALAGELVGARMYVQDRFRLARWQHPGMTSALIAVLKGLGVEVVVASGPVLLWWEEGLETSPAEAARAESAARGRRISQGLARRKAKLAETA